MLRCDPAKRLGKRTGDQPFAYDLNVITGEGVTTSSDRMQEVVPETQIDDFLESAKPFREFRNFDQHRENPAHPEVWTVRINQPHPMIGTPAHGIVDPFPVYELLKMLEPVIGYAAFIGAIARAARKTS